MVRRAVHIECQFGFTFGDVVQTAQLAEQTGYQALWASDHLFWDADSTHRHCLEPWTLLTALAPLTTTLRLGSHVTCNAFRHPSMLAKTVACLDTISQGRVDCGMVAGWNERECRAYGIPFPAMRTRMAQLGEAVRILKQLWSQDRVTFCGQHYRLDDALCAGLLLERLAEANGGALGLNDAGLAARVLASTMSPDADLLRRLAAGQALTAIGLARDVDDCARIDLYDIVPEMQDRMIRIDHVS